MGVIDTCFICQQVIYDFEPTVMAAPTIGGTKMPEFPIHKRCHPIFRRINEKP